MSRISTASFVLLSVFGAAWSPAAGCDLEMVARAEHLTILDSGEPLLTLEPMQVDEATTSPDPPLGGQLRLTQGSLVATVIYHREGVDSRGQAIPAGEWQLRYILQPPLKEHVDTGPFRDFLMVVPADTPTEMLLGELVGLARQQDAHPTVLAVVPSDRTRTGTLVPSELGCVVHFSVGEEPLGLVLGTLVGSAPWEEDSDLDDSTFRAGMI